MNFKHPIRKSHPYNTRRNKMKRVRTVAKRIMMRRIKYKTSIPKCHKCREVLPGIKITRRSRKHCPKRKMRTVSRPYGGILCGKCLTLRIIDAFLLDEEKKEV